MATKQGNWLHSEGAIDPIDALLSPAFVAASLVSTGIATISVFGYGLDMALWSGSGATVTLALLVELLTLGAAWVSNEPDLDDLEGVEGYVPATMVAVMLGVEFVPVVHDLVMSSPIWGLPVVALEAAGWYLIAYY